jgi:hypothetical protein
MAYNKAIIAFFYCYSTEWICITFQLYEETENFEKHFIVIRLSGNVLHSNYMKKPKILKNFSVERHGYPRNRT